MLVESDFRQLLKREPFPEWYKRKILQNHRARVQHPYPFWKIGFRETFTPLIHILPAFIPVLYAPWLSIFVLVLFGVCLALNRWALSPQAEKEPAQFADDQKVPDPDPEIAASSTQNLGMNSGFVQAVTNFWWNDVEPMQNLPATLSIYFLLIVIQMQQEVKMAKSFATMIIPSIAMLTLAVHRNLIGSAWHVLANLAITAASAFCVLREMNHTAHVNYDTSDSCSHKYLPQTWALVATTIAIWALVAVPEREVSRWLRKMVICACACVYFNGGTAKVVNNERPWDWAQGGILRYYIWHAFHEYKTWGSKWPWLSSVLIESPHLGVLMASSVLFFEIVLSALAVLGLGEFGKFGLIRWSWSLVAISFHAGILLLMRPKYDIQAWIIVVLILDLPTKLLARYGVFGPTCVKAEQTGRASPIRKYSSHVKFFIAIVSSAVVFAWLFIGFFFPHVDADPNWPITSTPMYSTLFFLDPSVRIYSKLFVFNTSAPGFKSLRKATKASLFADMRPMNSTLATRYFGYSTLADTSALQVAEVRYHRCYSPHFIFKKGVVLGSMSAYVPQTESKPSKNWFWGN